MRYAQIRKMDISNGEGVGAALFTQGCHFHCKGCHNPEQWSFDGGYEYTDETQSKILELISPSYIKRFSILGGEPLEDCNLYDLVILIDKIKIKKPDIKIWIYTGYTYEELIERDKQYIGIHPGTYKFPFLTYILNNIDYLVDGPFIQEEKDITLEFRGSANQRILDMKKIRQNK